MDNCWKFVKWDIPPLENLKDSFPYRMRTKVNAGEKLTQEEKDELYQDMRNNTFSKHGIPLQGWMFNFSDYCHLYYVEDKYGYIEKVWAPNKTSIRHNRHEPPIRRIVEVPQ